MNPALFSDQPGGGSEVLWGILAWIERYYFLNIRRCLRPSTLYLMNPFLI